MMQRRFLFSIVCLLLVATEICIAKKSQGLDQPMTLTLLGDTTGGTYTGPLVDGKPHGEGKFRVGEGAFDGGNIVGTFVDGDLSGTAKGIGKDGNVLYEGEWQNGVPHGQGVSYYASSKVVKYEGGLQFGQSHGQGKAYDHDGELLYDGGWQAGNRHGFGKMFHDTSDHSSAAYEGMFEKGRRADIVEKSSNRRYLR